MHAGALAEGELSEHDPPRPGSAIATARAIHRAVVLFVLLALTFVATPVSARASAAFENETATHAYLLARYKLATATLREAATVYGAQSAAAAQITRECPRVLSSMPRPFGDLSPTSTPRARGESARLNHQQQTIELELATAIVGAGDNLDLPAEEVYAAEVRELSWSNPTIASLLQVATATRLEDASIPVPPFCADATAWAQSGYRALSAASLLFEASQEARKSFALSEEQPLSTLLEPYENASDRALVRKTGAVENKILNGLTISLQKLQRLDRIVGFSQASNEQPEKQILLDHGRTAAGTRFVVNVSNSSSVGVGACHWSATVSYTRLGGSPEVLIIGGPNNPICLSSSHERHPAMFCEAGLETIQTAVPASVRSVKLMLADGRTIESRVVHVPAGDGGPAGIYAQQLQGSSSHAVSLVELNASAEVILTLGLPRYHCVKPRRQPELLASTELTTGHTPQGQAFTIRAVGSFNGEPFLSVATGVNPQLDETTVGLQSTKAFPWSLSIGCAPHPYAILYGILAPPGKSVTAQTPQGADALNVVPIEPRLHAKGPLVYGVFSTLPSELTVLGANGSIVYSESLQAQAAEVAQFCEGYEEP